MKTVVMSDLYPSFCHAINKHGYNIIPAKKYTVFNKPEQQHADMEVLKIKNRMFTIENCMKTAGEKYPENVRLNCLYLNGCLYGKLSAADTTVLDYCQNNGIKTVNVNQGYARCSTLIVAQNAAITADKSIEKALKSNGAEALLISEGNIRLEGFDHGFIGGASFTDENTVYFFGNVKPDFKSSTIPFQPHLGQQN